MSAINDERGSHRAVAFADLAGYTALTEAHGDTSAADVADRFTQLTESAGTLNPRAQSNVPPLEVSK